MDPILALAGFGVGAVVGLTGMGGGALMTPVLVLLFGVPPLAAVSSDLLASAVMKPFGGFVHIRRGTVRWPLVGWLCLGSVPSAFSGVLLMRALGGDDDVQHAVQLGLGAALLLAAVGMLAKAYVDERRTRARAGRGGGQGGGDRSGRDRGAGAHAPAPIRVRPLPTVLLGALGGVVVGMTSVGSGSLIIVTLLLLYPALRANDLVGTDIVQAVPLVAAAAVSHAFFGDLHLDITGSLLLGSIPGVLLGATMSSRAPGALVRNALVVVLTASSLKLLGASNQVVIVAFAVCVAASLGWWYLRRRADRRAPLRTSPLVGHGTTRGKPDASPARTPLISARGGRGW